MTSKSEHKLFKVELVDGLVLAEALRTEPHSGGAQLAFCGIDLQTNRLHARLSWHAMNDAGYYVGYEYAELSWQLYDKAELGVQHGGLPYSMSPLCTALDSYTTHSKSFPIPEAEWGDYGYYPALLDEDFVAQEVDYLLRDAIQQLDVGFNADNREWYIQHHAGGLTWPVGGDITWQKLYTS